jgi:hypothetical protein
MHFGRFKQPEGMYSAHIPAVSAIFFNQSSALKVITTENARLHSMRGALNGKFSRNSKSIDRADRLSSGKRFKVRIFLLKSYALAAWSFTMKS